MGTGTTGTITGDRWARLKEVVGEALQLPEKDRESFLLTQAGDDSGLLAEARALVLAGSGAAGLFVLHPRTDAIVGLSGPDLASLSGHSFGRYELLHLLGEGAMAAVYLARQRGFDRPVALKIFRPHAIGYDTIARFTREVKALERVDHPHVARILDAGVERDAERPGTRGTPYIVMEYVDGQPLTTYATTHDLPLEDKLLLMAEVAEAVHACHGRAIVHRDLKPGNVLVTEVERNGGQRAVPKVLDFGIARVLQPEESTTTVTADRPAGSRHLTLQTTAGVLLGTLGYMSPEQARGEADQVDVRSDVYSLGVILHELVIGSLPIAVAGLSLPDALRRLGEADVMPPRLNELTGPYAEDLKTILLTALAREPEHRYASTDALAADLRRLLRHEPIRARPPTKAYLVRKFIRRHRVGVIATGIVLATLATATTLASVGLVREARARAAAEVAQRETERALLTADAQRRRAEAARGFLSRIVESSDLYAAEGDATMTLLEAVQSAVARLDQGEPLEPVIEAELRQTLARALNGLGKLEAADVQFSLATDAAKEATSGETASANLLTNLAFEHAQMLAVNGRLTDAQERLRAAEALLRAHRQVVESSPRWPQTELLAMHAKAAVLDAQGRWEEAAELYSRTIGLAESRAEEPEGFDRNELERLRNNAGSALLSAGRPEEALELFEAARDYRADLYGPEHPTTLMAQINTTYALAGLGRMDEAEQALRDAMGSAKQSLPHEHPMHAHVAESLVQVLLVQKAPEDLEEALELSRQVVERRRIHDDGSTSLVVALNTFGNTLGYLKRHAEAAEVFRETLGLSIERQGPQHPGTLSVRANLAQMLAESGDVGSAVEQLRQVLAEQETLVGPENESTVITRNNLAMLMLKAGQATQAVAELDACIQISETGGWGALTPILRRNLGRAQLAAGAPQLAAATLEKAWGEAQALGPVVQQRTAAYVAHAFTALDQPELAQQWRERAGDEVDAELP